MATSRTRQAVRPSQLPWGTFMISSSTLRKLIGLAVAVAVPSIGCFGFYTLDAMGETGKHWPTLVILAYPIALVGLVSLVVTAFSSQRTTLRLLISAIFFIVPALFLLLVRL